MDHNYHYGSSSSSWIIITILDHHHHLGLSSPSWVIITMLGHHHHVGSSSPSLTFITIIGHHHHRGSSSLIIIDLLHQWMLIIITIIQEEGMPEYSNQYFCLCFYFLFIVIDSFIHQEFTFCTPFIVFLYFWV